MNKGELIRILKEKGSLKGQTDTAIPADWANKARELGIDTTFYVWNYTDEHKFGHPVNLADLYLLSKELMDWQNLQEVNYGG